MLNADVTEFLDKQKIEYDLSVPMSEHTTFRIGGNADCVCFPNSLEQLKAMIVFFSKKREHRISFLATAQICLFPTLESTVL